MDSDWVWRQSRSAVRGQSYSDPTSIIGIWVGFRYFGNVGAIMGIALNDLFYYLAVNYGLLQEGLNGMMQDLLATFLLLACLALIIAVRLHLNLDLPIHSLLSQPA